MSSNILTSLIFFSDKFNLERRVLRTFLNFPTVHKKFECEVTFSPQTHFTHCIHITKPLNISSIEPGKQRKTSFLISEMQEKIHASPSNTFSVVHLLSASSPRRKEDIFYMQYRKQYPSHFPYLNVSTASWFSSCRTFKLCMTY